MKKGMIGIMVRIEVRESGLPWFVGIGTILVWVFLVVVQWRYPSDSVVVMAGICLLMLLMIGAGIWMCMNARNRKMIVEDTSFSYTNWFGKEKRFTLEEIAVCKTALESDRGKDYIKIYDRDGEKLCKLEYNMRDSILFLQYLLDNQIKVECSDKSDTYLKNIIYAETIQPEEIADKVNAVYTNAAALVKEWTADHKRFGVEWKMGIAVHMQNENVEKKQLWELEGYTGTDFVKQGGLPEGCLIMIEGYLQKNGEFVFDKKNRAVLFGIPLISVSKSWQIGTKLAIRYWDGSALTELSEELAFLAKILPQKRYHTETVVVRHELAERL